MRWERDGGRIGKGHTKVSGNQNNDIKKQKSLVFVLRNLFEMVFFISVN